MKFSIGIRELRCPFCDNVIEQPKELKERKPVEFPVGACEHCGAVYAYDATGHNQGAAFVEALLFACNYDDYLAFSLSAGVDYTDAVVESYDIMTHQIVPDKNIGDRYIRGVLIFVKLLREFQEVAEDKVKEKLKYAQPISKSKLRSEKFSKEKVHTYVSKNNLEGLIALAEEDSRVISELQKMLYTPDEISRWKTIEILSNVSEKVGEKRPDIIAKYLSRLLQSATYSGASAWGAIEASAAMISRNPHLFGEYSQAILSVLKFKEMWKEAAWAIGRIASVKPDLVKYASRALRSFLENPDPAIRGHAAWALGNIGFNDVIEDLKKLETDEQQLSIWKEGELKQVTVAQLAKEALEKINTCTNRS